MAVTPTGGDPPPASLLTGLRLEPLDDARFAPGRLFASRYRIVSLLGRGAMGEVYRADDLRLGQAVALKLMSEAIARRHDGLQRLTDEVRLARGITHPNVCRVYDIGYAEGCHYLSMEYVDGETLSSLLRRIGQPSARKAIEMARQLCAGLGAAHACGVLHRDLKPSNIMVDGRGQIRIMDFGLAVLVAADVREVAGTPAYMSPEQAAGLQVTVTSDLFSLGRVLSEILPPDVDVRTTTVVQACLSPDPARRPASAHAVLAQLPPSSAPGLIEGTLPTPATVEATPTSGGLRIGMAWLLLAGIVGGACGVASQGHVFSIAPWDVPKPPEVLAEVGRQMLVRSGWQGPAVDRAFWWSSSGNGQPVRFTYRESSTLLVPSNIFRVVTVSDPPPDESSAMVTLNADGSPSPVHPVPRIPFASGRPVLGETFLWIGILTGFVAGSILAKRNLRAGEGDRRGASTLALIVLAGGILSAGLRAHHVPSVVDELAWLLVVCGWAAIWSSFSWLAYISSEPYIRRWWPPMLVSWTRLLAGQTRDPLVGRDLLFGALAGVASAASMLIRFGAGGPASAPLFGQPALDSLQSAPMFTSVLLLAILNGLQFTLGGIAGLVLLRLILRRTWIAAAVWLAFGISLFAASASPNELAFTICAGLFGLAVLMRVGVLAYAAMLIVSMLLTLLPLTLDADAWYFGRSLIVLLVVSGLAVYAFLIALGGRSPFGELARDRSA